MKFFVADFMSSEDVEMMTDAEVGQYCLLLFTAWLGGKDCTLPNDPAFLAKKAHCGEVSPAVMKKFESTDDGRLVNRVQQEVWKEQQTSYSAFSEAGKKGRAKQLLQNGSETVSKPPAVQTGSGPGPEVLQANRVDVDVMRKEKNDTVAAATASGNTQTAASSLISFSSSNDNSPTTGNGQQAPASALTRFHHPDWTLDPDGWRMLSDDAKLANIFYDLLPLENQQAAPAQWERLWSEDLETLNEGSWELMKDVLLYASRKKDKEGKRIYVRMDSVVKNWERLKAETLKIRKKAGAAKPASPVAHPPSNGQALTPAMAREMLTEREIELEEL